jgi:hypothetical protein
MKVFFNITAAPLGVLARVAVLPTSSRPRRASFGGVLIGLSRTAVAQEASSDPRPAPPRAEGEGPFERLIIRNAMLIDGTGAPARGPSIS